MFTIEQITTAHSKVRSGADFPAYIREIKSLGVTHYETYVADGRIDYHGTADYTVQVPAKYEPIELSEQLNTSDFIEDLKAHQQGHSDFLTFIRQCAMHGIEKWCIVMEEMSCTYYDIKGAVVLVETIPG